MSQVYVVGGGASLKGFDWGRLNGKRVMAVNRAYEVLPQAEVVYFSDFRFWIWNQDDLNSHAGRKITSAAKIKQKNIERVKITGLTGIDTTPGCIRQGNNSGYGAINLALHLGATQILLLGFDMKFSGGQCHWHDGYPVLNSEKMLKNMLHYFDTMVEPMEKLGVEVINLNTESELHCFKKMSVEEIL